MSTIHRFLTATAIVLIAAAPAYAQDAKKKAEDLNRAAMEDYDLLEFESARRQLNEALSVLRKAKLDRDKIAAKTHVNLAIVLGGGLADAGAAIGEFRLALEIDPNSKIDAAYKSAELNAMLEEAKGGGGGGGGGGGEPPAGGGDGAGMIEHVPIEEAKTGKSIPVKIKIADEVRAKQVLLFVRPGGADGYGELTMKNDGGTYKATIPADAVRGDVLHYYIEIKGAGGKLLATVGSSDSPNVVTLGEGGGGGGGSDDENPFGGGGDGDGDDGDDVSVDGSGSSGSPSFYLAVAAGTGGGYVAGSTEKSNTSVSGCPNCFAAELLHFKPELGFWINKRTTVSVVVRIGLPIGANVEGAATVAPAGLVKVGYGLGGGLTAHGEIGGGFMRQTIKLEGDEVMGAQVDTHATGPVLLGGGVSYAKPLSKTTNLIFDGAAIMGIPIVKEIGTARPNFGLSIDLSLGIAMMF